MTTNLTNKTNGLALETEKSGGSVQSVVIKQTNMDDSDSTDVGVLKTTNLTNNTNGLALETDKSGGSVQSVVII